MGAVSGGSWDQIVDQRAWGSCSDATLTTTFDFNGICLETSDRGTCCRLRTPIPTAARTAVYVEFDPSNPSGFANGFILLVVNLDTTTKRTGGLPTDPHTFARVLADGTTATPGFRLVPGVAGLPDAVVDADLGKAGIEARHRDRPAQGRIA